MQAMQSPKHSCNMTQAISHDKFAISGIGISIRIGIGLVLVSGVSVSMALAVSF